MAGALQLLARLSHSPVPPVPPPANTGEPREAAPVLAVPPVPSVPPKKQEHEAASVHTAASASTEWLAARDAYLVHLMSCRTCYAPAARHCQAGAALRASYDRTPLEAHP